MISNGDDRSVKAGNITGSVVTTGEKNLVSAHIQQIVLREPIRSMWRAELAALRELVTR